MRQTSANQQTVVSSLVLAKQLTQFFADIFVSQHLIKPHLTLAFSGGLDSCVLLHLLTQIRQTLPFQLSAHHVHHGLSRHADAWADFCQTSCNTLNIPLTISKVHIDTNSGLGVEAAARNARYAALLAANTDFICTAHHQDDQAETLLLQLARGAGVKGLSSMAQQDHAKKLLRPLLSISRAQLEAYAKQHQLKWVDDDSNANIQFDRNFMRHSVLPILTQQYPAIKQNLARSAQHLADASSLLDVLAEQDAQPCLVPELGEKALGITPLMQLDVRRVNNVLRWWLAQNNVQMPSTAQLQQIARQLLYAKTDAQIHIQLKADTDLTLRCYQNMAYLVPKIASLPVMDEVWQGETVYVLPNKTRLIFEQKLGEGLSLKHLNQQYLRIKSRSGGERIKPDLNRPSRGLKTVLQQAAMPPWQRSQLPFIYINETLAMIPNVVVDARLKAAADEMGLVITWWLP